MSDQLDLLLEAGIVRRAHVARTDGHSTLELGDQTGLLDPAATEPLAARVDGLLPRSVAGLAIGGGPADLLIGYLLGRGRGVPVASVTNVDGKVEVGGRLPSQGEVWLVVTLLDEPATIAEFDAACRRSGAAPGGVVALVDRLSNADSRVRQLARWADHVYEPAACPVCGGDGGSDQAG